MTGRVIIVTGANSGLGFETARYLAEGGNDVVLACRDEEKGEDAVRRIKEQQPNSLVSYMQLDLASMTSVREFVKAFTRRKRKLSVLINNAAVQLSPRDLTRKVTSDGHELTMATNYLGPFLMTNMLLEYLVQTANILGEGRIINVTCAAHDQENSCASKGLAELDVNNLSLQKEGTYNSKQAYKNSKLCDVLFAYKLADKLRDTRVWVNAIDPGYVPQSGLQRHASKLQQVFTTCCLSRVLGCTKITKSTKMAAKEITALATSDKFDFKSGKFYREGIEDRSSIESYDTDLQEQVWRQTCKLLNYTSSIVEDDLDRISLGEKEENKPLLRRP